MSNHWNDLFEEAVCEEMNEREYDKMVEKQIKIFDYIYDDEFDTPTIVANRIKKDLK